jgi:hypothetical protein
VIHSLRHSINTRMRKKGVDIKIRMKKLGHKSVKTSMRYDHVDDADQLEAAKKLQRRAGIDAAPGDVDPVPQGRKWLEMLAEPRGFEPLRDLDRPLTV